MRKVRALCGRLVVRATMVSCVCNAIFGLWPNFRLATGRGACVLASLLTVGVVCPVHVNWRLSRLQRRHTKAKGPKMGQFRFAIGLPKLAGLLGLMPDSSRRLRRAGEGYHSLRGFTKLAAVKALATGALQDLVSKCQR